MQFRQLTDVAHCSPTCYCCYMSLVDSNIQLSMSTDQIVGERVLLWLKRRGCSQAQLGEYLGVSRSSASKKIAGIVGWSTTDLVRTAAFLDVPLSELLSDDLVKLERQQHATMSLTEPPVRLELTTFALQERRSTN